MKARRPGNQPRILPIIRRIRNRWRLRISIRGTAIVLAAGFLAFALSAYGLEALRFSASAVTVLRITSWATVLILAGVFLVRPLLRRLSDEQVALYLEEHEPSLEAAILGAIEVEKSGSEAAAVVSPAMLQRLVERAVERARAVEFGKRIDQRGLYRSTGYLAVATVGILAFLVLGPAELRYGMNALFFPTTAAAEVNPYSITVTPGDVTVPRGSDEFVSAELFGFASEEVSLFLRSGEGESFQRLSMVPSEDGPFELLLLNLLEDTDYFVESNNVRSPTYTIEVAELPYVDSMDQTYYFPSYTGLQPRTVEDGGDIVSLKGTVVELLIRPTMATPGGRLLIDEEVVMELEPNGDGTFSARITVAERGIYELELAMLDGSLVSASPQYTIDVLTDLPPSISLSKPGRDTPASPIEEVYLETRADDDYGVSDIRLVYSVNGEPEDTVILFDTQGAPITEVSAGHTLFLEEWDLEAGDVISYYAIARDNRRDASDASTMSDIYFINVRPFGREYRQAEQQGGGGRGGGRGGGGGGPETALSELQKKVVSATFNLLRDRKDYSPTEFRENVVTVALAQGRVKEQVATLAQRMNNRGLAGADEQFREIAELLPEAVKDMETAQAELEAEDPREALAPEQRALRVLQKAEESYEVYVQEQQGGGGGGGGGQGPNADDLADLFELELDKLRNQYETVQRGEQTEATNEVDELLQKLDELARRQLQEMERQRRAAQQQGAAGGNVADSQREIAEQAEEVARQLERLAREQGDQRLQETARQLRDAAEAMRRAAANAGRDRGAAEASAALNDVREAQRRLQQAREDRTREAAQDALDRVNRLAESERQVQQGLERLSDDPEERGNQVQQLIERKEEMIRETEDLYQQIKELYQGLQREDPNTARELKEAYELIEDSKLLDKIAWSRGVVQQRDQQFARDFEDQIAADIENLRREMMEAVQATEQVAQDRGLEDSLERAQDLVRGTESLARRLQDRGQQGQQGQEGQQGQQGEQGQQGQQGEQGQQGQGRQGQGQQGGQGQDGRRLNPDGQRGGLTGGGAFNPNDPGRFGGGTRGEPRPFTEDEIRQFQREFQERVSEAQELRQELAGQGWDVTDLEDAIALMERLRDRRSYQDLPQVALLQEQIQQELRRFEFTLRREVEGENTGRAALSGSDEVPVGFRALVEEYYRSLARGSGRGGGG